MHEKILAVETAVNAIHRQFGAGSILSLGDGSPVEPVAAISTGSLGLDAATGVGGHPRGRVAELFGPKGAGKTTLALHAVASAQASGGIAAFVDADHTLDIRYAAAVGVQVDKLYLSQPDTGEQALEIVEILCRSGGVDLVVVDSVNTLTPRAQIEGEAGSEYDGLQSRLMSQALRKLTAVAHRTGACLLFATEVESGVTCPGANALKFYASVRLDVRTVQEERDGERVVGSLVRVRVVKNKVARPFAEAEFIIRHGTGIDRVAELADQAIALGVFDESADLPVSVARDSRKLALALRETEKLRRFVEREVRERLGLPPASTAP
ncbi:MAG: recombinase RecA [Deltaproteobacteria bacterium]|nr:recombinase RecA [Deltaproteobacteria bacterium]